MRRRIDSAASMAGRDADSVTLIVVTKTYPASDVLRLAALGVRDVGENRVQEATAKHDEVAASLEVGDVQVTGPPPRWHLVGTLQRNKVGAAAAWIDAVHSLDDPRLIAALDRRLADRGRRVDALVQVRLDDAPGRGGVPPSEAPRLADLVAATSHLRLRGVMAVAPLGADPRPAFERLQGVADGIRRMHPDATWISAGMSGDLEAAIDAGATHVRVGSAILGDRPPLG